MWFKIFAQKRVVRVESYSLCAALICVREPYYLPKGIQKWYDMTTMSLNDCIDEWLLVAILHDRVFYDLHEILQRNFD